MFGFPWTRLCSTTRIHGGFGRFVYTITATATPKRSGIGIGTFEGGIDAFACTSFSKQIARGLYGFGFDTRTLLLMMIVMLSSTTTATTTNQIKWI
jgi:hypothetical protein